MRSDRTFSTVIAGLFTRAGTAVCLGVVLAGTCVVPVQAVLAAPARGDAPVITTQPVLTQIIPDGANVTISVVATGSGLSYQWKRDNIDVVNNAQYAGATSATLTITGADVTLVGKYTCVVSNVNGSVTSNYSYLSVRAPVWNEFPVNTVPPNGASPVAFDLRRNLAVVWTSNCTPTPMNGTWELQGNVWVMIDTDGTRPLTCARGYSTFDNARHVTVQFGGTGADDRAYEYNGGKWIRSNVAGPQPRLGHRMVGLTDRSSVFMFGGRRLNDNVLTAEAYEYTGTAWTTIAATGPSARQDFAMTYDPTAHKVVVFGGNGGAGRLGDTWEYDVATQTWAEFTPANAPSPRAAASMAYFPEVGAIFMFGGFDGTNFMNDTWRYDCATHTWRPVVGVLSPPQLQGYAVYDNAIPRILLSQGSETWELRNYALGCPADFNHNDIVNSQDLFEFISGFFSGGVDFNGDQMMNSQDFFDFLAAFFSPC
ncbi:MAG: immunoglobulin domain-containing protein [Pyrinomonadaceae bacterium]|nr:immunoglobulin domain-containing protein [Phycisphaerales bacterium]